MQMDDLGVYLVLQFGGYKTTNTANALKCQYQLDQGSRLCLEL